MKLKKWPAAGKRLFSVSSKLNKAQQQGGERRLALTTPGHSERPSNSTTMDPRLPQRATHSRRQHEEFEVNILKLVKQFESEKWETMLQ